MNAYKAGKDFPCTDFFPIAQVKFSYLSKKIFLPFIFTTCATLAKTVEQ